MTASCTFLSCWWLVCFLNLSMKGFLRKEPQCVVRRSYKFRWRRHWKASAWVGHQNDLSRRAEGLWRVMGHSGHHRWIPPLEGWAENGEIGLRTNVLWMTIGSKVSGNCVGTGPPTQGDRLTFPSWDSWIICGLPSFHRRWLVLIPPSLISWRRAVQRGVLLLVSATRIFCHYSKCAHKTRYAGRAFPPRRDGDKDVTPYMLWSLWGGVSQLPSSSFIPSSEACRTEHPQQTHGCRCFWNWLAITNKCLGNYKKTNQNLV